MSEAAVFDHCRFGMRKDEKPALWGVAEWGNSYWGIDKRIQGPRFNVKIPLFDQMKKTFEKAK